MYKTLKYLLYASKVFNFKQVGHNKENIFLKFLIFNPLENPLNALWNSDILQYYYCSEILIIHPVRGIRNNYDLYSK